MESGQSAYVLLSPQTNRLINIQATYRNPPVSSHFNSVSHSKSCRVELAPTAQTPLKAVNTPFHMVPGKKNESGNILQ